MADPVVVLHHRLLPAADLTVLDGASITSVPRTVLDIIESHVDEELIESVVADALATGAVTKTRLERRFHELGDAARTRAERVLSTIGS